MYDTDFTCRLFKIQIYRPWDSDTVLESRDGLQNEISHVLVKIYSQVESLGDLEMQILTSGSSPWDLAQTVVDTTTTLTQLFVDVTVLYRLTSTSQAARQLLKRCCMVFSDCRRRCASRRSPACGTESKNIGNTLVRLGMNRIITILVGFVGTSGA
jgi:hypothetical protein